MPDGNDDCSNFCDKATESAGFEVPPHASSDYANSKYYERTFHPQAGDVMHQPGHVGVFSGTSDASGRPLGNQMGTSGAKLQPWGPRGVFAGGDELAFYRLLIPRN